MFQSISGLKPTHAPFQHSSPKPRVNSIFRSKFKFQISNFTYKTLDQPRCFDNINVFSAEKETQHIDSI